MTEPASFRRQPPSPLVFAANAALGSAPLSTNGSNSNHGSGSNTVSMPFVRRHVTRRLKVAKAECDKELQRVTNNITAFFEENLRERDQRELPDRERDRERDSQMGDHEPLREPFVLNAAELRSALQTDESSSDGGYEAEVEYNNRQIRPDDDGSNQGHALSHWASSPGLLSASSTSSSPSSLRRQHTLPRDKTLSTSASSGDIAVSTVATITPPPDVPKRSSFVPTSWSMQRLSRRLSRTIHIPVRTAQSASGQSSRSTSRSRSPLPPASTVATTHSSFSEHFINPPTSSANRRSSRILVDDPIDPIMTALYAIIGLCTDVIDMSVTQLTAQPKVCETLVQRVQNIGKAWDEHPDWHGRNWYVQVLLAVASLSRVVEWWEAEKQFWNFDDNDDEQDEPLAFVTKPADEPIPPPSAALGPQLADADASKSFLEDNKLKLAKPLSQGRRLRGEQPKSLASPTPPREQPRGASRIQDNNDSARVLATERLRLQAETAQNQNVIMELNLDGDHLRWANYAWRVVVGSVCLLFFSHALQKF
jgi:serine/threonine-protein kinase RIM15